LSNIKKTQEPGTDETESPPVKKAEKLTLKPFDIKRGMIKPAIGGGGPKLGAAGPSQTNIAAQDEFDPEESTPYQQQPPA